MGWYCPSQHGQVGMFSRDLQRAGWGGWWGVRARLPMGKETEAAFIKRSQILFKPHHNALVFATARQPLSSILTPQIAHRQLSECAFL